MDVLVMGSPDKMGRIELITGRSSTRVTPSPSPPPSSPISQSTLQRRLLPHLPKRNTRPSLLHLRTIHNPTRRSLKRQHLRRSRPRRRVPDGHCHRSTRAYHGAFLLSVM